MQESPFIDRFTHHGPYTISTIMKDADMIEYDDLEVFYGEHDLYLAREYQDSLDDLTNEDWFNLQNCMEY